MGIGEMAYYMDNQSFTNPGLGHNHGGVIHGVMGAAEINHLYLTSSCSSSSVSSNRTAGLSRDIYGETERCNHCDMQLSSKFYVASYSCGYCDEKCYRNFLIVQNIEKIESIKLAREKIEKLSEEKNTAQATVDTLNSANDELLKKNKELEKEIKIRDDGIDKFMLLDLD